MAITVAAGDRLTSTVYNYNVPRYQAQGSDLGVTTSAADALGGAISLEASGVYYCEIFLDVGNASTGGFNIRPSFVRTGGCTQGNIFVVGTGAGETSAVGPTTTATAMRTNSVTNSYGVPTATTDSRTVVRVVTILTTTTAGTFKVQVASSAGTMTLYTGSFMVIHRLT
jgi:hypothetical protein